MRTFEKDGQTRSTASPTAAVTLRASGWVEVTDDASAIPRGVVTRTDEPAPTRRAGGQRPARVATEHPPPDHPAEPSPSGPSTAPTGTTSD